jgi:hypothetical protein
LGQTGRTLVRRAAFSVLLGITGAFAVTALCWLFSSSAASAEESPVPPLTNVVEDATSTLGVVHDVNDTVHAVTTKVLPPPPARAAAKTTVADTVSATVTGLGNDVRSLVERPAHRPGHLAAGTSKAPNAPVVSKAPAAEKPAVPVAAEVKHAAPVKAVSMPRPAPPAMDEQQTERPVGNPPAPAPDPGPQPAAPMAPAGPTGGGGFHSPDTPCYEAGSSARWIGLPVSHPLRPAGPVVLRVVHAQPGVTPD